MTDAPFIIVVEGRPAPQGSKHLGAGGAMRESSVYLPAWRAAVKKAAYALMRGQGIRPADRPVFVGPVAVDVTFYVATAPDAQPDVDKLLRSTLDALTQAKVYEDDARVVQVAARKRAHSEGWTGADIEVWKVEK
jgi:Holliday junction resolvase RusA-like endonuclease